MSEISVDTLTIDGLMEDTLFEALLTMPSATNQAKTLMKLELKAKQLGVYQPFKRLLKSWQDEYKGMSEKPKNGERELNETAFTHLPDGLENMCCGDWLADDFGIRTYNVLGLEQKACPRPILLSKLMKNEQDGSEKATINFKKKGRWYEHDVDKSVIASATKIVGLSKYGVLVNSENAKLLVKYLSDLETYNEDKIDIIRSTSKLGWHDKEELFIPYDEDIKFDSVDRFKQIYGAVDRSGSFESWLEHMKAIRRFGRKEPRLALASSFSSILIKPLGLLPYFIDLWGETEGGKTVCLMVAASVWANPAESQYIGDFKTTDTALEARADMLNNLPVILDDTSKASKKIRDNFEAVVYDLCSGKGKSRSNKELGANRENHWSSCFIVNGERKLSDYVSQGGAINRIIEIGCGTEIFESPQLTANTVKQNYGYAGREFVRILKEIGMEKVKEIYNDFFSQYIDNKKMSKQIASLCCILAADKIATDYIFKDGKYITREEVEECLIDKEELSDNQRAYNDLCDYVEIKNANFQDDEPLSGRYGYLRTLDGIEYALFIPSVFKDFCCGRGYSSTSLVKWMKEKELLLVDSQGKSTKTMQGKRYYYIRLPKEDEFVDAEGIKLPFD